MSDLQRKVTIIPAKPQMLQQETKRRLNVAAYCRVSTEEEEQQSSYEAQCAYYTDKIMTNPEWTMAGIYADEGISGTSTKKRESFNRMIRKCRQKKIDLILTKSISRFARNTLDCLRYVRALREMGIGVYFEKENINTLDMDTELILTFMGAFAQSESESISANVKWGIRHAMKEGKVSINFEKLYGYCLDADGNPELNPDQSVVVVEIFNQYLRGASLRMIKDDLESKRVLNPSGDHRWNVAQIGKILANEKYCGDVLMQKTFVQDCISKKVVKNTGQLPMYLIQNNHPAIVSREMYQAAQAERTRRSATESPSKKTSSTGRSCYASKYALSERLVCGECGTLYRRCTWKRNGKASLFDGIGGFPLAAVRNGIRPVWASEIEAFPIEVTKLHFPDMIHVGDITKLNGADLPPVDIITGGSPCQDLSVAGARAGLAGERSCLFMEQIRVIKEMRTADLRHGRTTEHIRPRYGVWENVPGAFSSGTPKGEEFRIVLEEFVRIAFDSVYVPRPYTGRWEPAGRILLGDSFSLAWRVFDTQYWPGTPQRRRRIYLVVDFGGTTAPTILFDQESLCRDYSPGIRT